jgi:hypothetical protein
LSPQEPKGVQVAYRLTDVLEVRIAQPHHREHAVRLAHLGRRRHVLRAALHHLESVLERKHAGEHQRRVLAQRQPRRAGHPVPSVASRGEFLRGAGGAKRKKSHGNGVRGVTYASYAAGFSALSFSTAHRPPTKSAGCAYSVSSILDLGPSRHNCTPPSHRASEGLRACAATHSGGGWPRSGRHPR